ncbi:sodium ABC transporter ATP-binding protein [Ignicoccus pacificus DSM 13166]|uniref:Sodium ABC transporter ATP-binding protein n=1 Tax=Ignicoccus pacificus DSM 13166 TaxID=940294 RepID=A0A977K989_9CREN|nr:sodium ABC transporter ATP-binding protein [Ignicoccus pacificus DSM 13166]
MALLTFKNVAKRYLYDYVIKDFNLEVGYSEVVRLEGPNGSGKTTLLKLAAGIERPSEGEVLIEELPPWHLESKRKMGVVMHNNMTYAELTVRENLEFFASLYGVNLDEAMRLSKEVGLDKRMEQRAGELSFGWRKRLELVRALMHNPKLILLDEPFVGLDTPGKEALLKLLREALRKGSTVVYTAPVGSEGRVSEEEKVVRLV